MDVFANACLRGSRLTSSFLSLVCALAPCIDEGIVCYLSIELYNGDVSVCVQLNTPLSNHRNQVYEYCNKSNFEVIYKILKTLLGELTQAITR